MLAALLETLNAPLRLAEVALTDLSFGQVRVRVLASGICGAQLQEIAGHKGNGGFLPHLLGHEGCGIVKDVGSGVTRVKPGDRVVMHWRRAHGIESDYPRYVLMDGRTITSGRVTTFSEMAIVSENRVTPIPDYVPAELAAMLGCGLSTALGTIENEAALKMGESVLIIGVGGLGANLIRAAMMANAVPIVATDIADKEALAHSLGADFFVRTNNAEARDVLKFNWPQGFDVVIDTSGASQAIEWGLKALAPSGRFIMVGQPQPNHSVLLENARHLFEGEGKTIKATQGGGFLPDAHIPKYVKMYRAGRLRIDGMVTARVPLTEINSGIEMVRRGEAGRVMVEMQKPEGGNLRPETLDLKPETVRRLPDERNAET